MENQNDGTKDVVGSENESVAPEHLNSEVQNKNTEERVDNMETDSASSSSFPPLPQSKIPRRVAHTTSANFLAAQGKPRKGKKPDASQQSSAGPPPRKTSKTQ